MSPVPAGKPRRTYCERDANRVLRLALSQLLAALLMAGAWGSGSSRAEEPTGNTLTTEQKKFFNERVMPVLERNCFKCHSHLADKVRGGLVVDSRAGLLEGGDTGAAIVPGKPDESLLIQSIRYDDKADYQMPPDGKKLPDDEIAALTEWVKQGAFWPDEPSGADPKRKSRPRGKITDEDRAWWAFQPLKEPTVPNMPGTSHTMRNEIDAFILERLTKENLVPLPEASPAVLCRRVTFDLIGLPPSPEEVRQFVEAANKDADAAYRGLVDRLLDSPRYGERWARHWLDLVRYADSDGYRIDDYRPQAWRFRDYVIRSFNDDKPYDRFVQEQLAGDELFPGDPDALIATGYLRHGIYEYNNRDVRGQWTTILNDITDTTGDVFLGLGMQCARCHDHKFDPILQKDYYRLQAFFAGLMPRQDLVAATAEQRQAHAERLAGWEAKTADIRREIAALEERYRVKAERDAVSKFPDDIQEMIRKPVAERSPLEQQLAELAYRQVYYEFDRLERLIKGEDKERLLALRRQLAEHDSAKPAPLPVAFGATDVGPAAAPVHIPKRGPEPVEPGFLTLLDEQPAQIEAFTESTGRRAALAQWLTQPGNPLTARVMVNRVWQDHFGRGLAANASDFGRLGEQPTHPELLDWLASRFVQDGWSLKKLHRLIVLSATYRRASPLRNAEFGMRDAVDAKTDGPAEAASIQSATGNRQSAIQNRQSAITLDPDNRLYWRGATRRLEAEQIRDAIFAVTGELQTATGGPSVEPTEPRRSVYARIMRNTRDPLLDVFDAPFWFQSASSRDTTTTPVQSLLLINGQFLLHRAQAFAERVQRDVGSADESQFISRAYQLAFCRPPTAGELAAARTFLASQPTAINPQLAGSAQAAFVAGKIPYRDGQAAVIEPDATQQRFEVAARDQMPRGDFTIEAFVLLRSVNESGAVRTIASTGDPNREPAWVFGVTGKKSRRKPQTLVLQLFGKKQDGKIGEEAIFSDQHIQLDKPYYVSASVKLAGEKPGEVAFFVKDLSNDDEPLLVARVPHAITGGFENERPLMLGGRGGRVDFSFDGLIDDVRLSRTALGVGELLFTSEGTNQHTIGYWLFESKPDVFHDASGHGLNIRPAAFKSGSKVNPHAAALADFCHVLLNSNEFLYVE